MTFFPSFCSVLLSLSTLSLFIHPGLGKKSSFPSPAKAVYPPPSSTNCDTSGFQVIYPGLGITELSDVLDLPGDQVICAGQNSYTGQGNEGLIMKMDTRGHALWSKIYGGNEDDYFSRIIQTSDGGFLATGSSKSFGISSGEAWAVKTNSNGIVQWSYALGVPISIMDGACQTKDGGYALVASVNTRGPDAVIIVIKTDALGKSQWMHIYHQSQSDFGYCIKQSMDGNLLVSGFTYSFGAGMHDGYLMELSEKDGSVIWMKTIGSTGDDVIDQFVQNKDGNIFLSLNWGVTKQASLVKTDANGNILWSKLYTFPFPTSRGLDMKLTDDGGVILGIAFVEAGKGAVMKVDSSGNPQWVHQFEAPGSTTLAYAADELKSGHGFYVAGYSNIGSPLGTNGFLAKTDQDGNPGNCPIDSIPVTVSNISPIVQDHAWTISPVNAWNPVSIDPITLTTTSEDVCPACCIPYDTTIDAEICEGSTYTLPNDSMVNQTGNYAVKFTSYTGCDSTITIHLTVNPSYHITTDDSICPHQPYTLPDGKIVDSAGSYTSVLQTSKGCDSTIITNLTYRGPLHIQYRDSICEGGSLTLPDGMKVTEPGDYGMILPSPTGCDTFALYHISMKYPPHIDLGSDTCLISGQSLMLNAGAGYTQYVWQDGSADATMKVTYPGTYWVKVSNQCGSAADSLTVTMNCLPQIFIPSAFTPNEDGMNDIFRILNVHGQKLILFNIYNRWGKMVFHTTDISRGWDGTFSGRAQPFGTYVYLIKIINLEGKQKLYKGTVLLIR